MSAIDLYQVLREIPNVSEEQAKQAVSGLEQPKGINNIEERVKNTEERLIKVETKINYSIALQIGIFLTALSIAFG